MLIWGRVPEHLPHGLNGVCSNTKYVLNKGLMVGKTLVTVSMSHKIPIRILNATSQAIVIPKGKNIAEFSTLSSEYSSVPYSENGPVVQNIQLINHTDADTIPRLSNEKLLKVKNQFNLSEDLTDMEKNKLAECMHDNIDIFVTEENPRMGYTMIVKHTIILKPDAVGKQRKPYRLSPQKREILRFHLDNLLE